MHRPQQEFTFINVNAGKKSNTRTIKRHVSNLTNRRKRQEAVTQYQKSLLRASSHLSTSPPEPAYSTSTESQHSYFNGLAHTPKFFEISSESSGSPEDSDNYHDFDPYQDLRGRRQAELENYWPAYQKWAMRRLECHVPSRKRLNTNTAGLVSRPGDWQRTPSDEFEQDVTVPFSHGQVTVHIPRIKSPPEFNRVQWALKTCSDFVRSMYDLSWGSHWQDKQWFQGSLIPLGIWRESFPLAVELIESGKSKEAFLIFNAALNVTPAFFKHNNPGLLIALLGAMMYTCQISDHKLSVLIRSHITQLSMLYLGSTHPISMLLREHLRAADTAAGQTDLLGVAVIDTFADCFGSTHFVPLSMRFGYVRRQLSSGQYEAALSSIGTLEKVWNEETMPGAQLPKFLAFEKAKVLHAQQRAKHPEAHSQNSIKQDLGEVADVSVQLPVFVPGHGPALRPVNSAILKKLGKHLLFGSHYALALHIYSRIPEMFAPPAATDADWTTNQDPEKLPTIVSRILIDHLKMEMKVEE